MKHLYAIILVLSLATLRSQNADTLVVNYYENYPYAFSENGKLKGIEADIVEEYVVWMKQKKNVNVIVSYKPFREFSAFYSSVKDGRGNVIGLGSVTSSPERLNEVSFSAPYLQNVAVLITDGKVPTVRTKSPAEVMTTLGTLTAYSIHKSSHEDYILKLKKEFMPALPVNYVETQAAVLDAISANAKNFGYVDIVAYWAYLKNNAPRYLKIQKAFNQANQYFSFILPKRNGHIESLNEFFEGGFGFTSTKKYGQILEKYLGYEILESVEIK